MKPVLNPVVLSLPLPSAQVPGSSAVVQLLLEPPAPVMVPLLDQGHVREHRLDGHARIVLDEHAVQAPLVRVERERGFGDERLRSILPERDYGAVRKKSQRTETVGSVIQMPAVVVAENQLELDMTPGPNRQVDDAVLAVELVCLILSFHEQSPNIGDIATIALSSPPAMVLQDAPGYFERGDKVLRIHPWMFPSEILVCQPCQGVPGGDPSLEAGPDRVIDCESEVLEQELRFMWEFAFKTENHSLDQHLVLHNTRDICFPPLHVVPDQPHPSFPAHQLPDLLQNRT